jgi:hypothetical protein
MNWLEEERRVHRRVAEREKFDEAITIAGTFLAVLGAAALFLILFALMGLI